MSLLSDIKKEIEIELSLLSHLYLSIQPTILGYRDLAVSNMESSANEMNHWMLVNHSKSNRDKTELLTMSVKHVLR